MDEPKNKPTMYVLAGPNGAGKSTLYQTVIQQKIKAPFINADLIQKDELADPSMDASYKAAQIAADRRDAYISSRQSFIAESVFSHPSKLTLIENARTAGFRIIIFHVNVEHPNLSVARVSHRVQEGGHDVPEHKIRERYKRNQPLVKKAVIQADKALIYDNSRLNQPPTWVVSFNNGRIESVADKLQQWVTVLYRKELELFFKKQNDLFLNP